MRGDELADELLLAVLTADPLEGSLFGFPGYDELLPDFDPQAEREHARTLESIATQAEEVPEDGLAETELQTLDFVRCLARGMAGGSPRGRRPRATVSCSAKDLKPDAGHENLNSQPECTA